MFFAELSLNPIREQQELPVSEPYRNADVFTTPPVRNRRAGRSLRERTASACIERACVAVAIAVLYGCVCAGDYYDERHRYGLDTCATLLDPAIVAGITINIHDVVGPGPHFVVLSSIV